MSLCDGDARPIRKGSLATPTQFGYTGQVIDNRDGIVLDYEIAAGMAPDARRLAPAIARIVAATRQTPDSVTADRGYGEPSVDTALTALGVTMIAIPRKGQAGPARQTIDQLNPANNPSTHAVYFSAPANAPTRHHDHETENPRTDHEHFFRGK